MNHCGSREDHMGCYCYISYTYMQAVYFLTNYVQHYPPSVRIIHYKVALYHGDEGVPTLFGTGGCPYSTDSRTGLQCCGRLTRPRRLTTPRMTRSSALVAVHVSALAYMRCGRLAVRASLQTSRPTHPSASVYHDVAGSPMSDFNFT